MNQHIPTQGAAEAGSDDEDSDTSEENSYNENDDKKLRKKNRKKKDEKKYIPNRPIKIAIPDAVRSARNTRSKRKDESDDEESLYDEENMLMDEDDEDRPTKKTRASAAMDRRKRENRIRDKIDEKNDHRESMLHKALNAPWDQRPGQPFSSMMMMDPSQMMQYQMAGFPQIGGKPGAQQPIFVRQIPGGVAPTGDKKPQNGATGSDKDKNKTPTEMPVGMNPYGMMQMMPGGMAGMASMGGMATMAGMPAMQGMGGMTGEMMMKGIFGGQMPQNMSVGVMGAPPNSVMAMMPQMNGQQSQSSQKTAASKPSDKNEDSRSADMKRSMEMMYSQYPMYAAMAGNPVMAVMPNTTGDTTSSAQNPQVAAIPQMMNASSLSASLPQTGPFLLMPGGMTGQAQGMAARPTLPTQSPGSQQEKKKDSSVE